MDALKNMFTALGFINVVTYIQSGNVIFDAKTTDTDKLRSTIEKHLLAELGYDVTTIIRSLTELEDIIKGSPFTTVPIGDTRKQHVTMLSAEADMSKLPLLTAVLLEDEEIYLMGRECYMLTDSYGNTKLSNTFIEKKLGLSATTRNWATMNKVIKL